MARPRKTRASRRIAFDTLFRVNCSWRNRGPLTRPQLVFLGDARCLRLVEECVFAFRTVEEEARLLTDRLLHGRLGRLRYLTVERLPVFINERRWPARSDERGGHAGDRGGAGAGATRDRRDGPLPASRRGVPR